MKRSWIEFSKRRIKGGLSHMRKRKRLSCTGHRNKIGKTACNQPMVTLEYNLSNLDSVL